MNWLVTVPFVPRWGFRFFRLDFSQKELFSFGESWKLPMKAFSEIANKTSSLFENNAGIPFQTYFRELSWSITFRSSWCDRKNSFRRKENPVELEIEMGTESYGSEWHAGALVEILSLVVNGKNPFSVLHRWHFHFWLVCSPRGVKRAGAGRRSQGLRQ